MAKFSRDELDIMYLPEKRPAIDTVKLIRLNPNANILDTLDLGLTPYLILPASLIGKNSVDWIFLLAPTQSGKTVFLQLCVADAIDQDPGTLLYILPDEKAARKQIKEKIMDMIKYTKCLADRVISMSLVKIELDNMTIHPGWGGSLSTLSSTPAKKVVLDEIRLMKLEIGEESNAIKLANDRLTTYRSMGLAQGYGVSTPSVEGDLLHQQLTIPGTTVLVWNVRCSHCGKVQVLDFFKNIYYNKEKGKAFCKCVACGNHFSDKDNKREMNKTGFYAISGSDEPVKIEDLTSRVVCWYDSLVSPFRTFDAIYTEYIQTRDKIHDYKNFIQCWLARFWINDISKTSVANLKTLFVEEPLRLVPSWTKVITAGVDTQDNGFYVVVRAHGDCRRSRVIDAFFILCSMHIVEAEPVAEKFKMYIEDAVYSSQKGEKWKIATWAIDTGGHRTKQVYEACDMCDRAIKVKGRPPTQTTTIKYNSELNLYLIRTGEYLEETEELSNIGGGLYEVPANVPEDYLIQWCNVRKVAEKNKKTGDQSVYWKKVGQCDYRYADIHSFICLDISTDVGTFRTELEKDEFKYNPYITQKEIVEMSAEEIREEQNKVFESEDEFYESNNSNYNIGTFSKGW